MKKVYLITSGCYSDYHVECAFSSRELAEAWLSDLPRQGDYSIEEFALDDMSDRPRAGLRVVGDLISGRAEVYEKELRGTLDPILIHKHWTNQLPLMSFEVDGSDKDRALKIFSEKRAQFLAQAPTSPIAFDYQGSYDRDTLTRLGD